MEFSRHCIYVCDFSCLWTKLRNVSHNLVTRYGELCTCLLWTVGFVARATNRESAKNTVHSRTIILIATIARNSSKITSPALTQFQYQFQKLNTFVACLSFHDSCKKIAIKLYYKHCTYDRLPPAKHLFRLQFSFDRRVPFTRQKLSSLQNTLFPSTFNHFFFLWFDD